MPTMVSTEESQSQNLEAGMEAEAMEECAVHLFVASSVLNLLFYTSHNHLARDKDALSRLSFPHQSSVKKMPLQARL